MLWAIGNALEVMECVEILRGEHGDSELAQMSFRLAAEMLVMGGAATTLEAAQTQVQASIHNGMALATLRRFVALNGGDALALDDFSRLPQPGQVVDILADRAGYISAIDGRALGILAMDLGAGRRDRNDILDLGVGIRVLTSVGQEVRSGDRLFQVYAKRGASVSQEAFRATLELVPTPVTQAPWLLATIT